MTPPNLPTATPRGRAAPAHPIDLSWLLPVAILAGVAVLAWVLRLLWRRYRDSEVAARGARQPTEALVGVTTPELPVLRQGVAAAQRWLDQIAEPGNAIVAAWLALEDAAASSGLRRGPAETPTEFTVDVLRRTAADPDATRELLGLYHRARFSAAGVGPADVVRAGDCLAALASSWAAMDPQRVPVAASGPDPQAMGQLDETEEA